MSLSTLLPPAILLLGPTGTGKSPLGDYAAEMGFHNRPCRHFDFGAQLRSAEAEEPLALSPQTTRIVREVLLTGRLLHPDEFFVAAEILQAFLAELPGNCLVILNGLPRTIEQARDLEPILQVKHVVVLEASPETILARIESNSGGDRTGRTDDAPAAVRRRLDLYVAKTQPLISHYQQRSVPISFFPVQEQTQPAAIWQQIPPL